MSLNSSSAPEDILHLPQHFTVQANDRVWRRITGLGFDQGFTPVYSGDVFNWGIAFPALGLRSEFDYLQFLYPRALTMADMLLHTSNALKALNRAELLEGEYWRWLGIRLVTVIEPRKGGIAKYWEATQRAGSVFLAGRFGERFHMSRQRFQEIERCICFAAPAAGGEHGVDAVCMCCTCAFLASNLLRRLALSVSGSLPWYSLCFGLLEPAHGIRYYYPRQASVR